jgi:hypothetical protein
MCIFDSVVENKRYLHLNLASRPLPSQSRAISGPPVVFLGALVLFLSLLFLLFGLSSLQLSSAVSGSRLVRTAQPGFNHPGSDPGRKGGRPPQPGAIPIYLDGALIGGFTPADLQSHEQVSFVGPLEGKTQQGWRLNDILLLFVDAEVLQPETVIVVSSASRGKSASLTWAEVQDDANLVMFDLSNRGTLKLVSQGLPKLDEREEWVQDSDKIEIFTQQP